VEFANKLLLKYGCFCQNEYGLNLKTVNMPIIDLFSKAIFLAKSVLRAWQLFVCLLALSIGLFFFEKKLSGQKAAISLSMANAQKDDTFKYQDENIGLIKDVLTSLASHDVKSLWIEEMLYTDKKCTFDIKMRSLMVSDIHLYISTFMDSKLFKDHDADIGYSSIMKRGYNSDGLMSETSTEKGAEIAKAAPVPFIVRYLREQKEKEKADAEKHSIKTSASDKAHKDWGYEFKVKFSFCN
jgi:hypothetical protein